MPAKSFKFSFYFSVCRKLTTSVDTQIPYEDKWDSNNINHFYFNENILLK